VYFLTAVKLQAENHKSV